MKVRIERGTASGTVLAPASKSMAHRLLICAALCEGVSVIKGVSSCEDVLATLDCMAALGVRYEKNENDVTVYGTDIPKAKPQKALYCRESGSTLRFFVPIALLCGERTELRGADSLLRRPMSIYEELADKNGFLFEKSDNKITVKGPLEAGDFIVKGNISSQFISGLMFALPLAKGDSRIRITPPVESRSYIELTVNALATFGVKCVWEDENTLFIAGSQKYKACKTAVEGDFSGTAFIEALALFGGKVSVRGLNDNSAQGDRVYREYFEALDHGTPTLDIGNCPDLGPILFAVAAAKNGATFTGTKRLRIKESDRVQTMADELAKFGAILEVYEDSVVVANTPLHVPETTLFGHNDHRVVMALSVLLTLTGGEIDGAEAISKSYPEFFDDIEKLGIKITR